MEAILILIVIGLIGLILIGSIMGLISGGRISKLEQQNRNLNARLKVLEGSQISNGEAVSQQGDPSKADPSSLAWHEREEQSDAEVTAAAMTSTPKPPPQPIAAKSEPTAKKPLPPLPPRPTPPEPAQPKRNLEELIGAQWSVWVGGLALLVGAVLLIRFSIEAGFFGPAARIGMAVLLGVILLAAGEWLKRADDKTLTGKLGEAAKALQDKASVPALLSAVGIFTLLGASYAAHELYNLIPAIMSFMALAVISLGAMGLSLRQGPWLAAIGLLASFATPLLIQTDTPSLLMLVVYLVLIGGSALLLSRRTEWGWLATGTVFGWLGWSVLSFEAATNGQLMLWSGFLALGFAITVWFAAQNENPANEGLDALNLRPALAVIWGAVAALLVVEVGNEILFATDHFLLSVVVFGTISTLALAGVSVLRPRQSAHLLTAGFLAIVFVFLGGTPTQVISFMGLCLFVILIALYKAKREEMFQSFPLHTLWAGFAVGFGILGLALISLLNPVDWSERTFGFLFLSLVAIYSAAAWIFYTSKSGRVTTAIAVMGAMLAWLFAAAFIFDGLYFSLALSSGAALLTLLIWRQNISGLRLALITLSGIIFAHALFIQFPEPDALSLRPIFNALWAYLALPTAILAGAAFVLHPRKDTDEIGRFLNGVVEAAALAGLALFAVFQIRHLSNGGEVYADSLGHAELGLQVSIGLCFTLAGLSKRLAGNLVLSKIAEILSYITLGVFAIGSLFAVSPLFSGGENVSGSILFNSLVTGLLVPTLLMGLCAFLARGKRSDIYINALGGLALAGALSWVTAFTRFLYNGADIDIWRVNFGDLELWTISAVWLAFGVALLALGVWRRDRALRIASGIVIILTVLKAFLIDMAGLEGVLRAVSFVVLGLILIVIGRAYQRYWLSDSRASEAG
jgi:uncharacterized membrane protein